MVIDEKHRIVGLNPAAQRWLAAVGWKAIGQDARVVLSAWPELLKILTHGDQTHTEITINDGQDERIFDASVSPLLDPTGRRIATLVLWLDATEMKAAPAGVDRRLSALAATVERERLARELHDGLAQVLGYIKMQAQAGCDAFERERPDEASAGLRSILAIAQEAHEEIRDFLLAARVAARANSNFWSAVAGFAERYSTVHGLKVDVSLPKRVSELYLDPETQVQLLRIIQESLSNVRRHAGVSSVGLSFTREKGWLQVTVHDNGMGFDPLVAHGAEDGHYGLSFMRERAQGVGGRLDVISAPGQGTAVFVQVPLAGMDGPYATALGG
jgi:signal transduction histidine kinase